MHMYSSCMWMCVVILEIGLLQGALAQRVIVRNPLEDILNNCRKSLKQGALEFQEKVEKLLLLEGI